MVRISPRHLEHRIKAAKEGVTILQVAQDLTTLRKVGQRWRGECPLCGNGAHSKAFSVSEAKGLFYCHACGLGGDLVRLIERWGPFSLPGAVAYIGHTYGIDLPGRPDSWFHKQDRQMRIRERMREERRNVHRRRLFRIYLPMLESIEDAKEREAETVKVWDSIKRWPVCD